VVKSNLLSSVSICFFYDPRPVFLESVPPRPDSSSSETHVLFFAPPRTIAGPSAFPSEREWYGLFPSLEAPRPMYSPLPFADLPLLPPPSKSDLQGAFCQNYMISPSLPHSLYSSLFAPPLPLPPCSLILFPFFAAN